MELAADKGEGASSAAADEAALRRRRLAAWLSVAALSIAAYWSLLAWDPRAYVHRPTEGFEGVFFEPVGQSPMLILVLTAGFVWQSASRFGAAFRAGGSTPLGLALLAPAVGIAAWAHYVDAADLLIQSLQLFLLGAAALLGGTRGLRIVRLPALFLFLAMPIPPFVLNSIIFPMQLFTAQVSQWILDLLGFTALRVGDVVVTRWGSFHVIETCAGLRGVLTLLMASVVYAQLFQRSAGRTLLLFAAAPIVGTIANIGRVQSIIFSPYSDISAAHTTQGVLMMVVGVLLLAGIDRIAEAWRPDPGPPRRPRLRLTRVPLPPQLAGVAGVLVAIAVVPIAVPKWTPAAGARQPSVRSVPRELDGWKSNGIAVDTMFLGSVAFSDRIQRRYSRGDEWVDVLVGEDDRLDRHGSFYSPKTAYPGSAWDLVDSSPIEVEGTRAELFRFRSREGRRLVVQWREGMASPGVEVYRSVLGLDRGPFRRQRPATLWRFGTDIGGSPELARSRLLTLASALHGAWARGETAAGS